MSKIIKQFSKIIVPFSYYLENREAFFQKKAEGKDIKIWNEFSFSTNHLFDYINDKCNLSDSNSIMRALSMSDGARAMFGLRGANSLMELSTRGNQAGKKLKVKLRSINLYLFETHIGFLDFDWEYVDGDMSDFVNANYFLSELKSDKNVLNVQTGKDDIAEVHLKEVIENILCLFDNVTGFDIDENVSFYDLKPIAYSAILLDKEYDELENDLHKLASGDKSSYKTEKTDICSLFKNSKWVGSDTTMTNVAWLVGDEVTDNFFQTQFLSNARMGYFYLFLLILNRKFTLLKRLHQINKLNPKSAILDEEQLRLQNEALSDAILKSQLYEIRCKFYRPSSVSHINKYYDYILTMQQVDIYEKELTEKTQTLIRITEESKKRLEVFENYRRVKWQFYVFLIAQIIGSITIFKSMWDIVEKVFNISIHENLLFMIIPIAVTLVYAIGVGIQMVLKYKEMKKLERWSQKQLKG